MTDHRALVERLEAEAERCESVGVAVNERLTFGTNGPWKFKADLLREAADALREQAGGPAESKDREGLRLPVVDGHAMVQSIDGFVKDCLVQIALEQEKLYPDQDVIRVIAQAVRCAREYETMRRLRSAGAPEPGRGAWQPIETCPENKSVLGFNEYGETQAVERASDGWFLAFGETIRVPAPRFWQPLPAPPADDRDKIGGAR